MGQGEKVYSTPPSSEVSVAELRAQAEAQRQRAMQLKIQREKEHEEQEHKRQLELQEQETRRVQLAREQEAMRARRAAEVEEKRRQSMLVEQRREVERLQSQRSLGQTAETSLAAATSSERPPRVTSSSPIRQPKNSQLPVGVVVSPPAGEPPLPVAGPAMEERKKRLQEFLRQAQAQQSQQDTSAQGWGK